MDVEGSVSGTTFIIHRCRILGTTGTLKMMGGMVLAVEITNLADGKMFMDRVKYATVSVMSTVAALWIVSDRNKRGSVGAVTLLLIPPAVIVAPIRMIHILGRVRSHVSRM